MEKTTRLYANGAEVVLGQQKEAREILRRSGVYQTLSNFGPLLPDNLERRHKHIETLVLEGYEFVIVEREATSFSFDTMSGESRTQREAWFQPLRG